MNIEELEQEYRDDCKATENALEEMTNALDWFMKCKAYRDKSEKAFKEAKIKLEAERLIKQDKEDDHNENNKY